MHRVRAERRSKTVVLEVLLEIGIADHRGHGRRCGWLHEDDDIGFQRFGSSFDEKVVRYCPGGTDSRRGPGDDVFDLHAYKRAV